MKPTKLFAVLQAVGLILAMGLTPQSVPAGSGDIPFDPNNFVAGAAINSPYWPLIPGTSFVYTNQSAGGCEAELFEVTNRTKSNFPAPYGTIVATEIHDRSWLSPGCDGHYALIE